MQSSISGFPEFLPKEQLSFNRVMEIIRNKFELYGFIPLDTPAVEKVSTLLTKGNDNEIYGLYRLAEEGGKKDLGLRFDLTVPLARYVAQHYGQLTFPYRRYHIAPVWRGERPQAGRYRQFYQCDIDIIGDGELSLIYDAELLVIICDIFHAIGLMDKFTVKINNRKLLSGLIKSFGISEDKVPEAMRIIDKIEKIDARQFSAELAGLGISSKDINLLQSLATYKKSNEEWLAYLKTLTVHEEFQEGVTELEQVLLHASMLGATLKYICIDPSLARGLSYYTGTVYETKLNEFPELGSVCGGGRYANLAENFTNKVLPGVGISIGISRLIPKMLEMKWLEAKSATTAPVLVTTQNPAYMPQYIQLATMLRQEGINTEMYMQSRSLSAQMKYANKKGFKIAIIADEEELNAGKIGIRDLDSGQQILVAISELTQVIKERLSKP